MDYVRYRPTDENSGTIHIVALLAAQDFAAMDSRIAAAKEERDALLIDGEAKALKQAEDRLRSIREEGERVEAIVLQLTTRHAAALRREMLAKVDAAKAGVSAANQAIIDFWAVDGAALTAMLARSAEMHTSLQLAANALSTTRMRALNEYPDDGEAIAADDGGASLPDELDDWLLMMRRASQFLLGQPKYVPPPVTNAPAPTRTAPRRDDSNVQHAELEYEIDPHSGGAIANGLDYFRNRSAARR